MSNIVQDFLAARSAKKGKPVQNSDAPVSRAEFNTLVLAVNALIEDFDTATSPGKIQAVINEALTEAAKSARPTVNARIDRIRLAPSDADDIAAPPRVVPTAAVANSTMPTRKPLVLAADRLALAPKGE